MNRIVILFFILVSIVNLSFSQEKTLIDGVFAVVGNHVIFHSDINNQIIQYQSQNIELSKELGLREKVIEELLFQKVLLHFSDLDSIQIENSEIENSINQRLSFFEQQLGSEEKIEIYFEKSILELKEDLKSIVKNQLLIQKMQYQITKNVKVSPIDVRDFYTSFNKDSLPIISTQLKVSHILKIPDAALISIEETLSKLEDLRNRIIKGADFSTMAILYSEDPGSSRNGGAYYGIKKGDFVKEFESISFSLAIDELSEIFKTEYGYHIAKLLDRRGNEIDIQHILMTPKISNKDMLSAKVFLDSLKTEIINNKITFSSAAKDFSNDKETRYNGGLLINPNTNNSFFSDSDLLPALFNEIELLSIGDITDPSYIKLPSGQEAYRIIKLVDRKDEHVANLEEDYSFLKNYCFQLNKEKELNKWYEENIQDIHIKFFEDMSQYKFYNNLLTNE